MKEYIWNYKGKDLVVFTDDFNLDMLELLTKKFEEDETVSYKDIKKIFYKKNKLVNFVTK